MKDDWAGPAQREEGFLLLLPPQQQVTVWDEGTLTQVPCAGVSTDRTLSSGKLVGGIPSSVKAFQE